MYHIINMAEEIYDFSYCEAALLGSILSSNWKSDKQRHSDVKIILEDGETHAHKFILSSRYKAVSSRFELRSVPLSKEPGTCIKT